MMNSIYGLKDGIYDPSYEKMNETDAKIAVAQAIFWENPELSNEQALKIGAEFIDTVEFACVLVHKNGRRGRYKTHRCKKPTRDYFVCYELPG